MSGGHLDCGLKVHPCKCIRWGRGELWASIFRDFRAAGAIGSSIREIDGKAESHGDREPRGQRAARAESRDGREPQYQRATMSESSDGVVYVYEGCRRLLTWL